MNSDLRPTDDVPVVLVSAVEGQARGDGQPTVLLLSHLRTKEKN